MPNTAQQDLLISLIAEDGNFFLSIINNDTFDLGTKVLYLERAITQNCECFLQSLDKIYNPNLLGAARAANIEFIQSLKVINDLCFNNEVLFHIYGTRSALDHYFDRLGPIEPNDFQTAIIKIINERIAALIEGKEEEVSIQKNARQHAERLYTGQTDWRVMCELPRSQRVTRRRHILQVDMNAINDLNGTLTAEQHQSIFAEAQQVVAYNHLIGAQVIERNGDIFAIIRTLTVSEVLELIWQLPIIIRLVNEAHISLRYLLELDPNIRRELCYYSEGLTRLINEVGITLPNLLSLAPALRKELYNASFSVAHLVNEGHIPLQHLLALEPALRMELCSVSLAVVRLVEQGHILIQDILRLTPTLRTELYNESYAVARLVNRGRIPLPDLVGLTPSLRKELFNKSEAVVTLVNEANVSLADLLAISPNQRIVLYNYPESIANLVNKEHIPFEQLSNLSVEQLRKVIADPESEESQYILNPQAYNTNSL